MQSRLNFPKTNQTSQELRLRFRHTLCQGSVATHMAVTAGTCEEGTHLND